MGFIIKWYNLTRTQRFNGDLGIFYLLFQIPSKVVFIYRCSHSLIDQKQANCKDYDKLQLDQLINKTKHSFQWSVEALQITLIHQDTDYSIQIYKAAGGYFQNVGTIKVNKDSIDNKINSVTFLENEIYVVQSKLKKVQIYSKYMPFELIYEITDSKLNQFNVKGDFIPQRVFANKKAKSSLIFIQTITELFIGIFSNNKISTFVLQKEITIIPEAQIEVAIGIENFFIIQKLDDKDLIEEYNYKHMNRIYKTKDLPLFDYKLQKPLTVDYSSQTGWLFLRAKDDKQTVILVYEPGVVSHNCLQTVLECKSFIQDEQKFDMALDGSNQMFLYFNNNTDHRFLSILAKSELYAIPYLDSQDYVIDVFTGIQITNFPKNNPLIVQNRIKILNSQSIVTIKQQLFDSKQKVFKFEKQEGEQIIDMDTNWYNGQVTSFSVHCQTCGSNLSIRPNIQRVADGQDMIYGIIDGAIYGEYGQVYQTRNSIIFQDQKGQFVSKFDIKLTTQNCELITVSDDLNYIFSSWHNTKNEVGIYVSICSQQEQQKYCQQYRQGFSTIAGIQKISKIQMADKKNLIILNTNPENFDSIDNMIVVATFNYDEISFSVQKKYLINDQYVGSKFLQIGDFDIAKYSINNMSFTTIIFTDINEGLYFAHFYYDASGTISKSISELFKIQSIQDNQLHLEENTKFYQVRVIFNKVVGTILQLNILVTTNNVAHYVIAFDLDISQPTQIISIIKKNTKLLYVLTPYSTWPTIDKIAYVNGYVAIPYTDSTSLLIGIYDLPNNRPVNVITIPFTHSISANYENPLPIDFALLLTKDLESKFPNLYLNINYDSKSDEYLIEKYQLRADPQLILRNSMSLDDEVPITLQLSNDFTQSIGQAYLKINDSPPPDDDKSNSNLWWIILIGVVGLILLVVIGFYIYKKIFKKKTVYRSKIPLDE
ncbi:unnamed protein product [Paramecium sonneborni]|uniref:Transmembrane protein n=1 Tax=Paramecium sonneborni TaxID=65129 RepID=A0A8S1JUV2_9CILI|nr:unnamed protein product [Paramecium sonneborni]